VGPSTQPPRAGRAACDGIDWSAASSGKRDTTRDCSLKRSPVTEVLKSPLWACLLFILLCAAFIPYAGLEDDELLFVRPLFPSWTPTLMLATYVGALKSHLYWPIFKIFGANVWSVRLPMVIGGAFTIWIFYYLAMRATGRFGAMVAVALLATSPAFVLTNTFDRGPVVLVQLLLVGGCYWFVRSVEQDVSESARDIALGFLCFGLATWTKAAFLWNLTGLAAGGLVTFRPEIRRALRWRTVALAAGMFLLGSLPLIIFNLRHFNITLSENAHLEDRSAFQNKWIPLKSVANGSLFAEDFVSPEDSANPKPAVSRLGRASAWIRERFGPHRETGFLYIFGALLAAVPWWWPSRAARFSLVFVAVGWLSMAATRGAGWYSSHVILLWPFPILFVACTLAALPWRRPVALAVVAMIAMNLLVLSQYVSQYERNGPDERFSDAIYPLSAALAERPGQTIYWVDWNVANQLTLLHQGRLDLRVGHDPLLTDSPDVDEVRAIRAMVSDPLALFVAHVTPRAWVLSERLARTAASLGYRKEILQTIADSNGRPVFVIYRFRPAGRGSAN
jgi:4-amino-4-deoxy-L-arabinose transferase-like glycosyltransferase